jgi:ligand-binding SRPBCC domain-containing protein
MVIHTLHTSQIIPVPREECWRFFSNPRNLARITPEKLGFEILSKVPEQIYPGLMIRYRVRPLFGVPMIWLTEITHVREGEMFVDEQRCGPYRIWHHEHHFKSLDDGRTDVVDTVTYQLPLAHISEIVHRLFVKKELNQIFSYRKKAVREIFGDAMPE